MADAPFAFDSQRTKITLAYRNEEYVADAALPRKPVGARNYKYTIYNKAERFTPQNSLMSRKGEANEVEFGATELPGMVVDYGLKDKIPQQDIDNAKESDVDPRGDAVEGITDLIMLDREVRVAGLIHNSASYATNDTISGTDQWDESASNPIAQILDALDTPFKRPNTMALSQAGATTLRRNEAIVKAYNGTLGNMGLVPMAFIKELFGLQNIVVGSAKVNTANEGQDMTLAEIWGKHCALYYLNPSAKPTKGLTFGWTAQYKSRIASARKLSQGNFGVQGGEEVFVGEMLDEKIVAKDVGHILLNILP